MCDSPLLLLFFLLQSPSLLWAHRSGVKCTQTFKYFRQYSDSPANHRPAETHTHTHTQMHTERERRRQLFMNSSWAADSPISPWPVKGPQWFIDFLICQIKRETWSSCLPVFFSLPPVFFLPSWLLGRKDGQISTWQVKQEGIPCVCVCMCVWVWVKDQ